MGCQSSKTSAAAKPEEKKEQVPEGASKTLLEGPTTKPVTEQAATEQTTAEQVTTEPAMTEPATTEPATTEQMPAAQAEEVDVAASMDTKEPATEAEAMETETEVLPSGALLEEKEGPVTEKVEDEKEPEVEETKVVNEANESTAESPNAVSVEPVAKEAKPTWSCINFCQATEAQTEINLEEPVATVH